MRVPSGADPVGPCRIGRRRRPPADEPAEVTLTKLSAGVAFGFER